MILIIIYIYLNEKKGIGMGSVFGLVMSSIDWSVTEEELKMTTKQQIKHSAKQMGSRSLAMAKSFALIGAMFTGSECIVESVINYKNNFYIIIHIYNILYIRYMNFII